MKCRKCGADLIPGNRYCVKCGAEAAESRQAPGKKRPVWVLLVMLAAAALGAFLLFPESHRGDQTPPVMPAASITSMPEPPGEAAASLPTATIPTQTPTPPASLAHIRDVTATSVYSGEYSYLPALIRDGDLTTAWVEGVSGQGEGESITVYFDETCRLSGFYIHAGYHKTASLFEKNSRPKEIELSFSDGSTCRVTLDDCMEQQTVSLAPIDTSSLTIRLISVYPGTTYTDTAISEIVPF